MTPPTADVTAAAREWDQLRAAFASSIMIDTSLSSLAQNLDGLDWPAAGAHETPAYYVDFTYQELRSELAARGHAAAVPLLLQILRETLAFDQPFGEMVTQAENNEAPRDALLRNLAVLGLPVDFPLDLVRLDPTARDLCRLEQVRTLGQFAAFAQGLSQNVIVGGELKRLLNALVHTDEAALAQLLPYRRGAKGVHLAEALAHAASSDEPAIALRRTLAWFKPEFHRWQAEIRHDPRLLLRELALLRNPTAEARAAALIGPHLRPHGGVFARLLHLFKRKI